MDCIRFHALLHPNRLALTDLRSRRQWDYAQLDQFVAKSAGFLQARGVAPGQRIACVAKNSAEIIVLHAACARLGVIFVPLNWRLSKTELKVMIDDCDPALMFGDSLAGDLGCDLLSVDQLPALCEFVAPLPARDLPQDLPSLILYTSGTTGRPKGVLRSERNIAETAINFSLLGEVDSRSVFLAESPMFHIIGLETSVRPPLLCGASIVVSDGFIPERTLSLLSDRRLGISHYFCVPQMAAALQAESSFDARKLHGLKAIFTGGAPHPAAAIREWLAMGISMVDGYGMSEAGTVFGMPLNRALVAQKAGSVGIPTPRVHARIVGAANQPVGAGVAGELQLKGDNLAVGYWGRDADYQSSFTDDGWFCTGDILTLDEDGFYRVADRKKDMFISGGENVYPAEIESLLVDYPGIQELAVVGIPDARWGEVGCVFYVAQADEFDAQAMLDSLHPRLAKYKIPKQAVAIDALPRNGLGKILKQDLKGSVSGAS